MKNSILILFFLTLFLSSCEKELEFTYHYIDSQLVIEGLLDGKGARVTLSYTTPMNEKLEKNYLTDGDIVLIDETTCDSVRLTTDQKGIYSSSYAGKPGHIYGLAVKRAGKRYSSRCMMRPAVSIQGLKFQWIKMPYDYVAVLQIDFEDLKSENDCYWIRIFRNGEPYKWLLSDDRSAVNGVIREVTMTSRKDLDEEDEKDILRDGDEVKVAINAISQEMYDYLTAIQNDSNGPEMFEGDFCLGYFLAADSASDSIIFHPDQLTLF